MGIRADRSRNPQEFEGAASAVTANVTVTGLLKRFGAFTAVDRINLEIPAGQFFTLLGPSGCGKTTTLRMLAGLERPDGGEIRVGDRVVSAPERGIFVPPERRQMGMVFQSYAVWPHMTVFENVAFPLREQRRPKPEVIERTMETLALVGLADLAHRPAPNLSGGQQQRVALARALVANPQVLLLDEPLSNLDARLREQMRFEIRNMQARLGITTIFVTHDQLEAMTLSDQVGLMNAGHVEQIGAPRDVYERPETRYTMDFLGQVNHLPARIVATNGVIGALVAGFEVPLAITDDLREGDEVVLAFRSESVDLAPTGGHIRGTVLGAMYIGGYMEYVVEVAGSPIYVRAPAASQVAVGESVGLVLTTAAVRAWRTSEPREEARVPDPRFS
jgi:iron(III) transport system ATP-binding protein